LGVLRKAEEDMSMSGGEEPFGARLYAELRRLSGYNVITGMLYYKTIQVGQNKVAGTVKC
jgi:hypothetical protein